MHLRKEIANGGSGAIPIAMTSRSGIGSPAEPQSKQAGTYNPKQTEP